MKELVYKCLVAIVFCIAFSAVCLADKQVVVGIYDNAPIVFMDADGKARGVYIDILQHIASKESWSIRYKKGTWEECLNWLETRKIDILTAIAYSEDRNLKYDFSKEAIVTNWGQIYTEPGTTIRSPADLHGIELAVVKGDIYYEIFKTLAGKFQIYPHFAEVDSYLDALSSLEAGNTDAALVPRIFGKYHRARFNVQASPIKLGLKDLRFAVPKGSHTDIITLLDSYLSQMKKENHSIYHRSMNLWVEGVHKVVLPKWLKPRWVLGTILAVILVLSIGTIILRWQVRVKSEALAATMAEKEKIESELRIAHDIQMGLMPKQYPVIPGYEVYAQIHPAKEVGGDFYDFFYLDDHNLFFVIGDVSGKGVPAALFMASTSAFIKQTALTTQRPDEILYNVNQKIMAGNEECMFVTLFCGILNLDTKEICFSNAGHNPPIVMRPEKNISFLSGGESPALGIDEEALYIKSNMTLKTGEMLFLYTDGVTEAFNEQGEMFSEERLQSELASHMDSSSERVIKSILKTVYEFSGTHPQADDITVVALAHR